MLTAYTPHEYTTPARQTMAPPPGRALWCVRCTKADARLLVTALRSKPVAVVGGVEVWEDQKDVLIILDEPSACQQSIKATCETYGKWSAWYADLDITGAYYSLDRAWEILP